MHLRTLLTEDHRYLFTLIHKFNLTQEEKAKGVKVYPKLSDRSDVIVMTDEAHRSQYDVLALNMRNALPHAAFIGFTGTPLIKGQATPPRYVDLICFDERHAPFSLALEHFLICRLKPKGNTQGVGYEIPKAAENGL